MSKLKLSVAAALPERTRNLQLAETKDASGAPMVIRCEAMRPLDAVRILKRWPGASIQMGVSDAGDFDLEKLEPLFEVCQRLIEMGTALAAPDGGLVRPAFYFDASKPRHELSLDGNLLSITDVTQIGLCILELSGFSGGAATKSFPGRK